MRFLKGKIMEKCKITFCGEGGNCSLINKAVSSRGSKCTAFTLPRLVSVDFSSATPGMRSQKRELHSERPGEWNFLAANFEPAITPQTGVLQKEMKLHRSCKRVALTKVSRL